MKLGIDIGNYQTKTSEGIIFDSRTCSERIYGSSADRLIYNGEVHYLGEGNFDIEARKFDKNSYMPILLGAIAKSTVNDIVDLGIGLPMIQYKARGNREELIEKLQNSSFKFSINGTKRELNIRKVKIFPEGVTGIIYLLTHDEKLKTQVGNRDIVVIDIGGKTTDIALIENRKAIKPTSLDVGTINIYDAICKELKERFYDVKIEREKIQNYLDRGFYYKGEEQNIQFALKKTKNLFGEIYSELKLNYPITTEAVVIIGGGAKLLGEVFRNNIPSAIAYNGKDNIFCNAYAYKELLN